MSGTRYCAVWEFQVKPQAVAEFERVYGPDGLWAQLFRRSSAYLGTELLRDAGHSGRYLTIDRWTTRDSLRQFKQEFAAEYATLDQQCERLTEVEKLIGDFEETQ
ncbi:MAG TPA: antibiotic biosynthesis monooxygenase [Terriglobales bacterium]|nr:antibiotic biosynthesis monooxygenase [Terriglobales bacterium]